MTKTTCARKSSPHSCKKIQRRKRGRWPSRLPGEMQGSANATSPCPGFMYGKTFWKRQAAGRRYHGFSKFPTGFSKFQTGFSKFPTGFSKFPTGFSKFPTGFSKFPTGFSKFPTGFSKFPTGFSKFPTGFSMNSKFSFSILFHFQRQDSRFRPRSSPPASCCWPIGSAETVPNRGSGIQIRAGNNAKGEGQRGTARLPHLRPALRLQTRTDKTHVVSFILSFQLVFLSFQLVFLNFQLVFLSFQLVFLSFQLVFLSFQLVFLSFQLVFLSVFSKLSTVFFSNFYRRSHGLKKSELPDEVLEAKRVPMAHETGLCPFCGEPQTHVQRHIKRVHPSAKAPMGRPAGKAGARQAPARPSPVPRVAPAAAATAVEDSFWQV